MVEILSGIVFGTIQGFMTGGISLIISLADICISLFYQVLTMLGCVGVGGVGALGGGTIMSMLVGWIGTMFSFITGILGGVGGTAITAIIDFIVGMASIIPQAIKSLASWLSI